MNESSSNMASDSAGIAETITTTLRQPSFLRVMLVLSTTVVVLVGMRLGAPILNPIFFAIVLTLTFYPVYSWLRRRGLPTPLALVVMLVGLTILFVVLILLLGSSISRFTERVGFYTQHLNGQLVDLDALIERLGLPNVDLRDVVKPSAIADAFVAVLSGIAGFLSNLFLILMIMLFLLGEGPAMMNRLRASVGEGHPQVARLATVGQRVVRQFALRTTGNLGISAGVTVLLFLLGVDFPLLWGILTFFLSFIPYAGPLLAATPAAILALAEFGPGRALLVIAGVMVIYVLAENVLSPMSMGRGLNLSPTVVFLSFIIWVWVLGGPGAFLAVPLTLFVAVMFDTFPETRWLASIIGVRRPDTEASGGTAPGTPTPAAEAEDER
jgi:AI-2 transport protein TqsA